jgi:hypothetical protein
MIQEILLPPFSKMKTRLYDQAFHNKLLHCGELGEVHLCQPLKSSIATVGMLSPTQFSFDPSGTLLNEAYRKPSLKKCSERIALKAVG